MSSIDILFWLLVALMGGVAWAVEAGLGARHRKALASCVVASLASGVIIMFWIEDNTKIEYAERKPGAKKKKHNMGEIGMLEQEHEFTATASNNGSAGPPPDATAETPPNGQAGQPQSGTPNGMPQGAAPPAGSASGPWSPKAPQTAGQMTPQTALEAALLDTNRDFYKTTPFKDCENCPDIVILPAGSFKSGSPLDEPGRDQREWVQRESTIDKPFAIGRLEILRDEFKDFVTATGYQTRTPCQTEKRRGKFDWKNPGFEQDDRHAVTCITTDDVAHYLAWLSGVTGRTYRLPTELEWEYAARAGTSTAYWTGSILSKHQANFGRSRDGTVPAGSLDMNPFGLADMAGNVWEMTSDCSHRKAAPDEPGPEEGGRCDRIIKGGAWNSPPSETRHGARRIMADGIATNSIGFRVVRGLDERDKDQLLSMEQRRALVREEQQAADMKRKEQEAAEKARFDAREAAVKAAADAAAAKTKGKAPVVPAKK